MSNPTPAPWPANEQPEPPGALTYGVGFRGSLRDGNGNIVRGDRNQVTETITWIAKGGCWSEIARALYEKVSPVEDVAWSKLRAYFPYDADCVQMDATSLFATNISVDSNGAVVMTTAADGSSVPLGATVYEVEGPPFTYVDDVLNELSHIECQGSYQSG